MKLEHGEKLRRLRFLVRRCGKKIAQGTQHTNEQRECQEASRRCTACISNGGEGSFGIDADSVQEFVTD